MSPVRNPMEHIKPTNGLNILLNRVSLALDIDLRTRPMVMKDDIVNSTANSKTIWLLVS